MRTSFSLLALLGAAGCGNGLAPSHGGAADSGPPPADAGPGVVDAGEDAAEGEDAGDPFDFSTQPGSCAYTCPSSSCAELTTPYACPSLGPWAQIPHDTPCPAWDGTNAPIVAGKCAATTPSGDAIASANKTGTPVILPDGRRVAPAGKDWLFNEVDVPQSIPVSAILVPGTTFALVVDEAYTSNNAVRVVDTSKIDGVANPTVSYVTFANPSTLNRGIAFVAPGEVYVATDDGNVQALTLNIATGALALDDAHSLTLPASVNDQGQAAHYYVEGLAASPDGTRLVVTSVFDSHLLVFDVNPASPTFGTQLGSLAIGPQTFGAWFDPHDAAGQFVYVSVLQSSTVLEVDVSTPASPTLSHSYAVDKSPQGVAFLDGRWMAVANDFGDSIALIDRTTKTVTPVPISLEGDGLHGADPTTLAFDATANRLYVTLAGANAIDAWSVNLATTPPTLGLLGQLATAWWPSDVVVLTDGSLVVPNLKGHGNGPYLANLPPDDGDGMAGASGGIQKIPAPTTSDLTAGALAVSANDDVSALAGHSTVTCPAGADDFPVPSTNTSGASKLISHVIFIVRENKAFDGVFGDLPTVNGDPALTAKTTTADLDKLWTNLRDVGRTFALSDNYYTDAELSVQGHQWTTYARTSDYCEREWIEEGYSRSPFASPVPTVAVATYGQPVEGSLFDWLGKNKVPYVVLGEGDGIPAQIAGDPEQHLDSHYPGGLVQSIGYPDNEKACYFAGRERVLCDLGNVTYMTLPNDHCSGVSPTTPSPETMIATNDEATGMVIDAVSHGPLWASSLVIVTEDDPQQGGDHVDHHRTPIVFASPWIKHGYVSKTHMDVPSIAKIVAHVFGIPYPNGVVARAALPLDLFTSTPDYTPYTYTPRQWPLSCGEGATKEQIVATSRWDLSDVDNQPGLDEMVTEWLRRPGGTAAAAAAHPAANHPPLPSKTDAIKVVTTASATTTKR